MGGESESGSGESLAGGVGAPVIRGRAYETAPVGECVSECGVFEYISYCRMCTYAHLEHTIRVHVYVWAWGAVCGSSVDEL